jgi:hypothetical protein
MLRMSTKMMCSNAKEKLEFSTKGLAASRMSYYFFFLHKKLTNNRAVAQKPLF